MQNKKPQGVGAGAVLAAVMIAAALAFFVGYSAWQGTDGSTRALYQCVSDGCFVAGFVYTAVGSLSWVSTTGFFNIFGYGVHSLLVLFTSLRRPEEHESYAEYCERKNIRRKPAVLFILVIGLCLLALSAVTLYLFYRG